jgi:hypothetical protein
MSNDSRQVYTVATITLIGGLLLLGFWFNVLLTWLNLSSSERDAGIFSANFGLVIFTVICIPLFIWLSFLSYKLWLYVRDERVERICDILFYLIATYVLATIFMLPVIIFTVPTAIFAYNIRKRLKFSVPV